MWVTAIVGGVCSVCNKTFKNNKRRINIALDVASGRLVCKACGIQKVWDEYYAERKAFISERDE